MEKLNKKITLKTIDDGFFNVESEVAKEIGTVQPFIDESDSSAVSDHSPIIIPLPNVRSKELSKILDYCNKHHEFDTSGNVKMAAEYDKAFMKEMSHDEIKEVLNAANYLDVKKLSDFMCQAIADHLSNKSVEYVRRFFAVENDLGPQEEVNIREENAWAALEAVNDDDED